MAEQSITDFFSFSRLNFGQHINKSGIIAFLQGIEGVIYVEITELHNDIDNSITTKPMDHIYLNKYEIANLEDFKISIQGGLIG